MKRLLFVLPALFILSSCINTSDGASVYLDNSEVITSNFRLRADNVDVSKHENYSFSITIFVKNLSPKTQSFSLTSPSLIRESTGSSYTVESYSRGKISIDSELEEGFNFTSTIPSTLDEKYYFSINFNNFKYKVLLYETPDELREDLTVTYILNGEVIHTDSVKKGRTLQEVYSYETADHQKHATRWKYDDYSYLNSIKKIEENMTVVGELEPNYIFMTTSTDIYTILRDVDYVPKDGKIVIMDQYNGKEVCLGNCAIYTRGDIKEVYLPATLHQIYSSNFENCPNLKAIYFAGTEEQWEAIPKEFVEIPSNVKIVFNTPFTY